MELIWHDGLRCDIHGLMNEPSSNPQGSHEGKGKPIIAWVGIGCGTILVIAVVCIAMLVGFCKRKVGEFTDNPEKAAAELMVKYNPDLKMVSQDDAKGEMTIRTKDGQEMTMSYKDISKGKFTIRDADGNVTQVGEDADLSNVPAWVPRVQGMTTGAGSFQSQEGGKVSGIFNATTRDSVEVVEAYFKSEAEKLNLASSSQSSAKVDGVETRALSYEGGGKVLTIILTAKAGEDTQVNVSYEETK